MRISTLTIVLLSFLCFGLGPVHGQVDRTALNGTVLDPSGAVISGAQVTAEAPSIGVKRRTATNTAGVYSLPSLPVGTYNLTISKEGFQTKKLEGVVLRVGQVRTLDLSLDILATATEVVVTAEAPTLQQNNAELGLAIEGNQVLSIPLNGRNWTALMALAPGATNTGEGNQNSIRFNGRSRDDNNFTLDGVDATGVKDPRQEANLRLNISLDAISEFRVSSGLYNAESGNGAGAQMNLVSKTGSNEFHGGLFEYFRNDKLDARRPTDFLGKPPFRLNQFGGNLGGRLVRDKTFFFVNYEGLEQRLSTTLTGSVPSEALRQQVLATSPALRPVVEAYKPGTARTSNAEVDTLTAVGSQPWTEKSGMFRVDHRFNDFNSIFVRYNVDDGRIDELRNALLETRTSNFRTQNGVVQFQRTFSPALLSEIRLGVNRSALRRDTNGTFGEGISISGLINLQPDRNEVEIGTSYGLVPTLTWIRGRHTWKFGGEIRKIDLVLADTGQITTSFSSRALFVQNRANSVSFGSALPGVKSLRPYYFAYAQDEIKLTRTLTLSLGARYEYYSVAKTSDGRGRVFDLERCSGFCAPGTPWYFPDKNNWAPRAGLGWAPRALNGKTVFRLGYGIFYGPGQIDDVNAAIDSIPENYTLSSSDQPLLSFPAAQYLGQAKSTGVSARALQRDRREGYSQQWTFAIQQELPMQFVLQTAYVGGNGHQLFGRSFINTIDPVTRTRPYPNFSNVDIKTNDGNSSFQALQISLTRSMQRGFLWQTQYMWSHNINDNSGAGDGANRMISACRRCDRGDAPWDLRHTVTMNSIYEVPVGRGRYALRNRFLQAVAGGWNLNGVFTARTGMPFDVTVSRSASSLPDGVVSTPGRSAPAQRPNFVPGQSLYAAVKSPLGWLNPAAFAIPPSGTWGTLPRSALRGPGLWQLDLGVGKQAKLVERHTLEFRAEMFNLFNRAQYGKPESNFSNLGTFGTILSVVNNNPTGSGGPRQIQFMLRYRF